MLSLLGLKEQIRPPILQRLYSPNTLLRSACDASMILQAIVRPPSPTSAYRVITDGAQVDAIIDLAFPVVQAYQDTIAELELDVLTAPSVEQSRELYILTSELSLLKGTLSPIVGLVSSLKDHGGLISSVAGLKGFREVEVSDMTKMYLRDVDDHLLLLIEVCTPFLSLSPLFRLTREKKT